MFGTALFSKLLAALVLSAAAFTASVVLQGAFFFGHEIPMALRPASSAIRGLSLGHEDRAALVVHTEFPWQAPIYHPHHFASVYDLSTTPPTLQELLPHDSPWLAASARRGRHAFISTKAGELYWFDMADPPSRLNYLGSHAGGYGRLMECSDDGAMVVVVGGDTTAWDRQSTKLLWLRPDVMVTAISFLPESHRLICGHSTGDVVELDPATGLAVRIVATHDNQVVSIAISPDSKQVASVDMNGYCTVTEIETGCCIWSHQCRVLPVVRFTPNGKGLLLSRAEKGTDLTLFSLPSGKPIARLDGFKGPIKDVRVARDGTAYICSTEGAITAWNLVTGSITCRFGPDPDRRSQNQLRLAVK